MSREWFKALKIGIIVCLVVVTTHVSIAADRAVVIPLFNSDVSALEARVAQLEALLAGIIRENDTITFSGVNIQVVSGTDSTDGAVNGLGNIIVGYNEEGADPVDTRTGSHNLIIGKHNNYSSYGGLVVGLNNTASGSYSSVTGGKFNTASGDASHVSGGYFNAASGMTSSVTGGKYNTASGSSSSIGGGSENTASGIASSVSGGNDRSVSGTDDWTAGTLFQDN